MWLSSLRRFVAGKSRFSEAKLSSPQRRRIIPRLDHLEDRTLLSGGLPYPTPSTPSQLIADINAANTAGGATTITLAAGTTFDFTSPYQATSNALPIITANITIKGNSGTLMRDSSSASAFRLFDVASSGTLTLQDLTLTGGMVSGSAAKGGAVYNSGNLKMTSVHVGGNEAIGSSGYNGEGGGIYSNGGSLTLAHALIGIKAFESLNFVTGAVAYTTVGASNQAIGGTGGSGQGGGLYVAGGSVKISGATLGGNHAVGGANGNAQGGAIYINGGSVTLTKDRIGGKGNKFYNSTGQLTKLTVTGSANSVHAGTGGSGQGGGIYANATSLTLTNTLVDTNSANGGSGVAGANTSANKFAGGQGGSAQGGGIYANGTAVTISGGEVSFNAATPGDGGSGAAGTAGHPTGGTGGSSGIGQGGGVYIQGASLTISNAASVSGNTVGQDTFAGQGGAGYNLNGTFGAGGVGGKGNLDEGGDVFASNASVTAQGGAMINAGEIFGAFGGNGGAGGQGKAGGQGGDAGLAAGGGLYVANGSVTLGSGVGVNACSVFPGWGGYGGNGGVGGNGGAGGTAEGGGLYARNSLVTLTNGTGILNAPTITTPGINNATLSTPGFGRGGNGGNGSAGAGGNGGAGGLAQGGGVFASGSDLAVTLGNASQGATVNDNSLQGGNGGSGGLGHGGVNGLGGAGGLGSGGGLTVLGDKLTLDNATIASNLASGGNGGDGASSVGVGVIANFGNGGNAQGGGLFVSNSGSVTVLNSTFANDEATGGGGASGGIAVGSAKYGVGGSAFGGGIYANSSTVNVINSTFAVNLLAGDGNPGGTATGPHASGGGTAQGGGLYAANGNLTLLNDTIAWNYLVTYTDKGMILGAGGGLYNGPANSLSLENTIVALDLIFTNSQYGETNAYGTYNDFSSASTAALTKNDANLLGDGIDANLVPGASEQLFSVPLYSNNLGNATLSGQIPANFGGLTDTLPLAWNTSPAISTGDPTAAANIATYENGSSAAPSTATDQRGEERVIDMTIDIGATQTQVILDGSPSVTTVQPGGTIIYTLTVTNNESTTANVSLTDLLDPNTTYQSSTGASWNYTPPSTPGTGGTLTAAISLAGNSSATFTITVTVASNVPGNTVLANTASIIPTANTAAGPRKTTMDTTVPGVTVTNITSEIKIHHSAINPDPQKGAGAFKQRLLIDNDSGTTLTGPIALVLVGLTPGVTLTNASGTYNGYYYIDLVPSGGSWQAGWRNFLMVLLQFYDPNGYAISYTPQIVEGI
jgi:uncharacterized repeat protein (TIGR01451 family)